MLNWCLVWVEHYASSELQLKVHRMDNIFWGLVAKYFFAFSSLAISIQLMPIFGKVFYNNSSILTDCNSLSAFEKK